MYFLTVRVPVCDLYKDPSEESELISQALYGAKLTVLDKLGSYIKIECDDGYQGWALSKNLTDNINPIKGKRIVSSNFAEFELLKDNKILTLPHGSQLIKEETDLFIEIDQKEQMQLVSGTIEQPDSIPNVEPAVYARQFLTIPYLWGGISPFGFDCSGLVQAVLRRFGIILPRDSGDQMNIGKTYDLANATSSDLIFFPGHIAIYCGQGQIIHATNKHGKVVQEALADRTDIKDKITAVNRVWEKK